MAPHRLRFDQAPDNSRQWPVAFARKELTADVEATIGALVKKAAETS